MTTEAERVSPPRAFSVEGIDLNRTLFAFSFFGRDPTTRFVRERGGGIGELARATLTPDGPGTLYLRWQGARASATAFGPGARWLDAHAEDWCGKNDDVTTFEPPDRRMQRLFLKHSGVRMTRTLTAWHDILRIVIQQRIRTRDAADQWRRMTLAWGTLAPGPFGLRLPPAAEKVAAAPYFDFHPFGIEKKRADAMRSVAKSVDVVERAAMLPPEKARAALEGIRGVGPWTALGFCEGCLGDPDAVILGDYHLPNHVAFALAGEEKATDERMLELLAPYAPHRGRVVKLLMVGAEKPPRRAPRATHNDIRRR